METTKNPKNVIHRNLGGGSIRSMDQSGRWINPGLFRFAPSRPYHDIYERQKRQEVPDAVVGARWSEAE